MNYYNYDPNTFVYTTTAEADPDPRIPGNFLIPAHATYKVPPVAGTNEVAIFTNDDWRIVPDYRNVTYWLPDGEKYTIINANVLPPTNALYEPPPLQVTDIASNRKSYISTTFLDTLSYGYTCSNGIKMDAFDVDIAKLDNGYRLAQRLNATTMDICDYYNKVHSSIPLTVVAEMVDELGTNYLSKLSQKWAFREEVNTILQKTQLDESDPEYMSDEAASLAIDRVPFVQ